MNTQSRIGGNRRKVARRLLPIGMLVGGITTSLALPLGAYASTPKAGKVRVVMAVSRGQFGKILATTTGSALYTYSKDTKNHSKVTGPLLAVWPPLVVRAGATPVGNGVTGLGVIKRANGHEQVTYRGKPLYSFVKDMGNEVTGQGIKGFSVVKLPTTKGAPMTTTSPTTSTPMSPAPPTTTSPAPPTTTSPAPPTTTTPAPPMTTSPAPPTTNPAPPTTNNGIPQNNGGDGDSDNNGGPSDGDGNV
ncbi:MAG TPA: hypothetical protein VNV87_04840 [Acidimicrobiales bacterium]|nr:hypothetical protein [Acidimicrobiales bacterium]